MSLDLDAIEARAAAAAFTAHPQPDVTALVDALRRARDCAVALEQECARLTQQREAALVLVRRSRLSYGGLVAPHVDSDEIERALGAES